MPLPPTPEVVALDRARLATPEHILGALFRAQETAHRRGAPLAGDAAFSLLARRLVEVLPDVATQTLETACSLRRREQESAPLIVTLLSEDLGYASERKRAFHQEAVRLLRQLGHALGLKAAEFDVRWNEGGVAVSGEAMLYSDRVWLQVSQSICDAGSILFRATTERGSCGRGQNHWARADQLADPVNLAEHIARTLRLPSPKAAAGLLL